MVDANERLEPENGEEVFQVDEVISLMKNAAKEAIETKDFLSYSTIIDIYLTDPKKYTNEEREQLLGCLLEILNESDELVNEIGWDLPQLLLSYVESDGELQGGVRDYPGVYKVLKIFEVLAIKGNPKELFLKCCELLTTIKVEDIQCTEETQNKIPFFEIKLYCIFELVDASLKRIKTFYPSKFLSMVVSSFINLIHQNNLDYGHIIHFMLRRVYSFARNYTTLPLPDDTSSLSSQELQKVIDDEQYLQRKLLTGFITQSIQIASKYFQFGFANDHMSFLQSLDRTNTKRYYVFNLDAPVMNRLFELALSFDINLGQVFKDYLADGRKIFQSINLDQDEDDISGEIFEKLIIDYQKVVATTVVDAKIEKINLSTIGCILLYMYQLASSRKFDKVQISFADAVLITIRSTVPQMVQSSFNLQSMMDTSVFVSWYALYQIQLDKKNPELVISTIPKAELTIYYQSLLQIIVSSSARENFRFNVITLLTKILALSPESISYGFIVDSLQNCPYDKIITILVGIFKDLLTKSKPESIKSPKVVGESTEIGIEGKLAKVSLDDKTKPPPLPQRDTKPSTKYITLDQERTEVLFDLISQSIDNVFVKQNGFVSINPMKLSILSAYLNLMVVIKQDPTVKQNVESLNKLVERVEKNIISVKAKEDTENVHEVNAADMLNITIDRIKSN